MNSGQTLPSTAVDDDAVLHSHHHLAFIHLGAIAVIPAIALLEYRRGRGGRRGRNHAHHLLRRAGGHPFGIWRGLVIGPDQLHRVAHRALGRWFAQRGDRIGHRTALHILGHVHAGRQRQPLREHVRDRGQRRTAARRHRRATRQGGRRQQHRQGLRRPPYRTKSRCLHNALRAPSISGVLPLAYCRRPITNAIDRRGKVPRRRCVMLTERPRHIA